MEGKMQYVEVQWSFEYDNTEGEITDVEKDKWLNHPSLSKAYIPEEMLKEGVDSIEQAFESLTGISKKHIIVFDMEPYYRFNEELEFLDISDEDLKQGVIEG